MAKRAKVLLIYTGGTIGMQKDPRTGGLKPFNFNALSTQVPELQQLDVQLEAIAFEKPLDSSNMQPDTWMKLARIIEAHYKKFDGFVILHGSDTMSFTASALSFMLENLAKPVILTGSQLPIGVIRTDGKENIITAIEIAAAKKHGKPVVREVCIYFEYRLYRGNRTFKYNSSYFDAFRSPNYPELAKAGVEIIYNHEALLPAVKTVKSLKVHTKLDTRIAVLRLFPGVSPEYVNAVLGMSDVKAVVLETFGAGNSSTADWFVAALQTAIKKGVIILNITQCLEGKVVQGMYATSAQLKRIGVVSGHDMTYESAIAKLMWLLGAYPPSRVKALLLQNLRGELSAL